jgi:hypothetical protein
VIHFGFLAQIRFYQAALRRGFIVCAPGTPSQPSRPDHVVGENPTKIIRGASPRSRSKIFLRIFSGPVRFGISVGDVVPGDVILRTFALSGRLRGYRWTCYRTARR